MSDRIWSLRSVLWLVILGFQALQVAADEDVVANLQLSPALDMIDASWELENSTGGVFRYQVSWAGTEGTTLTCYVDSSYTNTSACDARPTLASCTHYTVTVQPQVLGVPSPADTGTPASAAAYTLAGDATISNAECVADDDLSITVTWEGPGECVEYDVSYTGTELWGDHDSPHDSLTTRNLTASFPDLLPYTLYSVAVNTSEADGWTSCNTTTPETRPSAPTAVTVTNISSTSAVVNWAPPDQANGLLEDYRVKWSIEGDSTRIDTTDTTLVLDNLLPCYDYTVKVAAKTGAGFGNYSTPVNFSTPDGVPPAVTSLSFTDPSSRSVFLSWTRPDTACEIIEYTVIYDEDIMWGEYLHSDNVSTPVSDFNDTDVMEVELSGLVPYSNYSITVVASTQAGDGSAAEPVYVQTDEDVPTQPTNLDTTPLNTSTVSVSWEPPEQENGIITNYTVSWRLANETTESAVTLPGDQLSYDVPDLLECLLYAFSVTASTSVGEGPEAGKETVAGGDVGAPENVSCSKTDDYVQVTWVAPVAESGCNITNYYVNMTIIVLWSGEEHSTEPQFVGLTPVYRDENAEPFSEYTFDVRASTGGSVLGPAGTCSVTTDQAAPSVPQNLALLSATTSTLSIQWQQPAELNGELGRYIVSWGISGSEDPKKNATVDAVEGRSVYNYTISGLAAGKTYATEVQGVTTEAGDAAKGAYPTKDEPPKSSSVAGIVIGCIFGILLLVAIIVAFIKRDYIKERYNAINRPPSNVQTSGSAESSVASSPLPGILLTIEQFESDPSKLTFAFEQLKARSSVGSTSVAENQYNMHRNRYINILPFDRTRVKLRPDWGSNDYINASYIKDWSGNIKFIASQGPKKDTVDDFWSMIWQENVRIIVMLANCQEGGKEKCAMYWPARRQSPLLVDQKYLKLEEEIHEAGYIRRKLSLEAESRREITQFHFTNWPDFGVPASEHALLSFLSCVRAETSPGEMVAVHCSAGVGRTGTFITLWNLQESKEHQEVIDIDDTILKIRKDRMDMVQSTEQYLYVFKCIAKYFQSQESYAARGASNRGYDDTENIIRRQSSLNGNAVENTATNRASSSSAVPLEELVPTASFAEPTPAAATRILGSGFTSLPPRVVPSPPRSSPPPLPPSRNSYQRDFETSQNYSLQDPPSRPPPRPPKSQSRHSVGVNSDVRPRKPRPPLPPRPQPPSSAPAQPRPSSMSPYMNYPERQYGDTDV